MGEVRRQDVVPIRTVTIPSALAPDPLTDRESAWLALYIANGFCAAAASAAAGIPHNAGYSIRRRPSVQEAIREHLRDIGVTREKCLKRLAEIAFGIDAADFAPLVECGKGQIRAALKDLRAEGVRTNLIRSISVRPGREGDAVTIDFHDSLAATVKLLTALGVDETDTEEIRESAVGAVENTLELIRERTERVRLRYAGGNGGGHHADNP
jgi:hypothetical protein